MNIAVIGAGNVGKALAKGWADAGHKIILGVKDVNDEKVKSPDSENISTGNIAEAAKVSDIILISLPVNAVNYALSKIGDIKEKIIIDATNSVFAKPEPFKNTFEALKEIAHCNKIVKCFNSTGFENMSDPVYGNFKADMFAAGSDESAKNTATQLSYDLGFENCYDFGGDDKVELLEQFAMCWINLAVIQKQSRDIAFKILKR